MRETAMSPYETPSRADEQREMYAAGLAADDDAALDAATLRDLANEAADALEAIKRRSPAHPAISALHRIATLTEGLAIAAEEGK